MGTGSIKVMSSELSELQSLTLSLVELADQMNALRASVRVSALLGVLQALQSNIDTFLINDEPALQSRCAKRYVEVLLKYMKMLLELLQASKDRDRMDNLNILTSKLAALLELFVPVLRVDPQDLFSKDGDDPAWQRLRQVTQLMVPDDEQHLQKGFQQFARHVAVGNAMLRGGLQYQNSSMKKIVVGGGAMYYFLCREAAVHQTRLSHANGDLETAKALWNLLDTKLVSPMYQTLIPSIHLNQVIYVPRTAAHILSTQTVNNSLEKVAHTGKHYIEQLLDEPIYSMATFTETMDPGKLRIPVRILSPYDLPLSYAAPASCWTLCCSERIRTDRNLKELIIHFHGGGFIAMSSNSHQNYTRRWATDTETPVLSVDYRLAPEHRYPCALDDCWQVYMWVINYAKKYLGVNPQKVVLAGDSAGGSLALGVALKCVRTGTRVPDGLLLTYPCVSLDVQSFSPSLELCLEDPLIPYSFLKLCAESYLRPEDDPRSDIFLSPVKAATADLSQFPPVRMMVCGNDPLLDESLRFADKLLEAGVSVKIAKFEGMGHGALNLDLSLGVREARSMVDKGTEFLKELLEI